MPSPEKTLTPARPIARLVVCLAVVLLGAVSAARLEVVYLPAWSFPELVVVLSTAQPSEVDELTRRWIQPTESAIRAVGDVTSVAGQVWTTGGYLRVRFRSGTDAERKAGRLESELAALRRELPPSARLNVWPAGQGGGERAAVVWLEGDGGRLEESFVDTLRALPEVREVRVVGTPEQELRIVLAPGTDPAAVEQAIERRLAVKRLGEATVNGRRLPVLLRGSREASFDELWVRHGDAVVPLASLAELKIRDAGSSEVVRLDGRRGSVLLIDRELGASPLALERALRHTFESFAFDGRYRFLFNEAEPLRQLVERLLLGVAVASAVTALLALLLGGVRAAVLQLLALPVALASALNVFALAGLTLDVTTLPMLAIALGWCLFYPVFRGGRGRYAAAATMLAGAAALAIAAALAGGPLAPLLQAPMRAFLCAQTGGIVALMILPWPSGPGRWLGARQPWILRPAAVGKALRWALRNPWTVLLATATGIYALLVLFGSALEPRPGNLRPSTVDLRVDLRFAEGTTLAQAEAQIALAEAEAGGLDEVDGHWSYFDESSGSVFAAVRPGKRSTIILRRLAGQLQMKLSSLGASAQVSALGGGGRRNAEAARFSDSLEDRPETDKAATFYRFLLRSTDLETLSLAHARVVDRIRQHYRIGPRNISSDWGRPAPLVELVPRPGTTPAERERAAEVLSRRASLVPARSLPSVAQVDLRIVDPYAPREEDEVRQRGELLGLQDGAGGWPPRGWPPRGWPPRGWPPGSGAPLVPGAVFEARETLASPSVKRQSGRYVLPVTVRFFGNLARFEDRWDTHLVLGSLTMPAACDLELPEINPFVLGPERRRMLAIAGTLVALLLALAVCRLNSVARGLLALVPLTAAVAVAAPWIRATRGRLDEMSLFALAASVVGSLALALHVVAARRRGREDYRWLVEQSLALGVAATGMAVLLLVPGLGLGAERHPWAPPLNVAGVAGLGSVLASYLCLGALQRAASSWRERGERRERRRETVRAWREPGRLELEAYRLTKVYGNGFTALRGVDLHLGPGIIGLLGPNGAGKTTLLRILCGLLAPSRGEVLYRGRPIDAANLPEYRRLVGFLPQELNAYEGFTGERFLDYWALEAGIKDPRERRREVERRLGQVGLMEAAERKVRDYSGGMRRRIGIARALVGEPPILIVDEPTTGLDVQSRNRLRESLLQVAGERIILFSTHIASDVAAAAARILVLDQGRLLYDGQALGLIEKARGAVFETLVDDRELRDFSHLYRVTTRVRTLDGIRVRAVVRDEEEPPGPLVEPNLEEAYLAVVGSRGGRRDGERSRLAGSLLDLESWRRVA